MTEPRRRNTWQRQAVRDALAESEDFVSAQALHARMQESGIELGLATVYRALASLSAAGEADELQVSGEQLYRACADAEHHHHLICSECGVTHEITADAVEEWAQRIASEHGFVVPEHTFEIFGICRDCAAVDNPTAEDGAVRD